MFDIGWSEMLVIGVIAIVVVGPKDLPRMMKTVGQYVGKAKRMAREFQSQFDQAVRESELDDVRKTLTDLKSTNPTGEVGKALNPLREAADDLRRTVEASNGDDDKYGTGFENSIGEGAPADAPEDDRPDTAGPQADTAEAKPAAETEASPEARPETKAEPASADDVPAPAPEKPEPKPVAAANG